MIFTFEVRPQAREELTDTAVYYESLSIGLGGKIFYSMGRNHSRYYDKSIRLSKEKEKFSTGIN